MQQVDDPPYLSVGTEVSAKYKGAFCEAKVRKVVRNIKCKVAYKQGLGSGTVSDDLIKGVLRVGATVEVKHPDKREYVEASITKIQDCSQYTVVFDDGDITTLRRTALCLKSGRHFNESETLDQLPLTHPEHFGNPVIGGRRGRRSRHLQDDSSEDEDDNDSKEIVNEKEEHIGKVVCVEATETKKKDKDKWFPGLVVSPTAQVTVRIRVKDEYLVRSFKDGRYYTVPKKEAMEFTRELAAKQDGPAVLAALQYLDNDTLPTHWDRDALFGLTNSSSEYEGEFESDSSDDEPREEKDHFVAQLYKYMDDRGTPLNKVPSITNRDVDLYRLFRAVQKLGGYNRVTSQNQWKAITLRLGFTPVTVSVTNLVKQAYKKFLQPFEEFDRKLGCSMSMTPRNANRTKGRSLVRANSVASPKPEVKEQKVTSVTEESENTSESSMDAIKSKRKLSTGSSKVKALIEKFEDKPKDDLEITPAKTIVKEDTAIREQQFNANTSATKKEKITKTSKQQSLLEEKKNRKRKEGEIEKGTEKSSETQSPSEFPVDIGDKLKVYYHEKKVTYEAKVIEITIQQGTPLYLVHYTGWNNRYDEWVPRERIAENLTTNKTKRSKNSGNQKSNFNTMPPNEGIKGGQNSDKNSGTIAVIASTSKIISGSKRGRGRSDSQPPRSTTPNRTKSPAAPATQRRTTRAQPSISRRTSNNISDISIQTDSDSDSDEPVKKPMKSASNLLLSCNPTVIGTRKNELVKSNSITAPNSQSETEEDDILNEAKGRDYDLNEIRSELKGFKELKSPSPEAESTSQIGADKKSNVVFNFNIEENESKITPPSLPKCPLSLNELKSSSTEMSSETDSFADDDSQSSDKTTTLENMTEKLQQKIKAEKLAHAKRLERISGGSSSEKLTPMKSASIEKIIKDSLAEKMQETMKAKPAVLEKGISKNIEIEEKTKSMADVKMTGLKGTAERKISQAIQLSEKKKPSDLKPMPIRLDKKLISTDKPQNVQKESLLIEPQQISIITDKISKDHCKPSQSKIVSNADIYEFKEPEPFEFETRKHSAISITGDSEKKTKKTVSKTIEVLQEPKISPTVISTKKNKKSPAKESEKSKLIKVEEKSKVPDAIASTSTLLLSPAKTDNTFDALRKSPSFNLTTINSLNEELAVPESMKSIPDLSENIIPSINTILTTQANIPCISPFVETGKPDNTGIFDLKADVANTEYQSDDEKSHGNKTELETVKKILLSDASFDLEPPKIEKPSSIADKVLKALNQQKQDEDKIKEEGETSSVIEAPTVLSFPAAEPPKIELSAIIKKEIEIPLKKPILSSPEHKLDILESIAPKNNDLSETIQKLESAIQKTSTVDHFDDDSSDSTDSEQRLVIEDEDSQSSETNQTEMGCDMDSVNFKNQESLEDKYQNKPDTIIKNESLGFAQKLPTSIFTLQAGNYSDPAFLADAGVKPISDILPSLKVDAEHIKTDLLDRGIIVGNTLQKTEDPLSNQDSHIMHSESINLLLCEETIPGSPTPAKESSDTKQIPHPIESDIKPIPMDIESGPIPSADTVPSKISKSENHTPNSSPRDSVSQDDSSEDLKKQIEPDTEISPKKKKRIRKHSEVETLNKRRKMNSSSKRINGSDSDENSDANTSQRSSTSRPTRPCQYNFLVQLDPALNPNQRIAILKKKIQELRKTYNMIKVELASIDRRRKKLRRREREKKNQQKLNS